jgi:hypothetical protein
MANMALASYTFEKNPTNVDDIIRKKRRVSSIKTFTKVAVFSWGVSIVGQTIVLNWDYMPTGMYESLRTLYEADSQVVFDPQNGTSKTYNVEVMDLSGKYFIYLDNASGHHYQNVKLSLLIASEV